MLSARLQDDVDDNDDIYSENESLIYKMNSY